MRSQYGQSLFNVFFIAILILTLQQNSFGYTVTNLTGECRNGQVFLTWTTPSVVNLQYNVYRSTAQFTSAAQLNSTTFIGFVRDSSSRNLRMTSIYVHRPSKHNPGVFFRTVDGGTPLTASQGLYVVTCTGNQTFFYAVMIMNLSDSTNDATIITGQNSLSAGISETVSKPLPVFQYTEEWNNHEMADYYVQFVNNQETSLYPAMNSTGSYGFNFYVLKRGNPSSYPLILLEETCGEPSIKGNGLDEFHSGAITNCYIIGVDDWLPVPRNGTSEFTSKYCCYHEDFNIYSDENPIPDHGIVKAYPQHRFIETIRWAKAHLPQIDSTRIYTVGNSAGGFGAVLTAEIIPDEIAAVYSIVGQISASSDAPSSELHEELWGEEITDSDSDIPNWQTGIALPIYTLNNNLRMIHINNQRDVPLIFDIHGKNDPAVPWNEEKVVWLDSLQRNNVGGVFYWDGRDHDGRGQDFLDSETTPDFFRYATNISFPAFSNCSVNQNPGNGVVEDGDSLGTINGSLDWDDDGITDNKCTYVIHIFMKDFTVGGVVFPNPNLSCTTDITFRRLQKFHPSAGAVIKWKNFDEVTGARIQNGSITYSGGNITLTGLTVSRSGNKIKLKVANCPYRLDGDDEDDDEGDDPAQSIHFSKSPNGYLATIDAKNEEEIMVTVYDLLGRKTSTQKIHLHDGFNSFEVPEQVRGIYLVDIVGATIHQATTLFY